MDLSEYLPLFLAEATEHLQELNLAVVRLEEAPGDQATLDAIFRIAHSFKGSSATMGFQGIAALTHRMEDVLELLRGRPGGLGREAIDVLLACLDALSDAVGAIEENGSETLDPSAIIARLDALVAADGTAEAAAAAVAPAAAKPDAAGPAPVVPTHPEVLAALEAGTRVVSVEVELDDEAVMPAVRAYQVIAALGDHGQVLDSSPTNDEIDTFTGQVIVAWLATEHEDALVVSKAERVSDVRRATVRQASARAAQPVAAPVADVVVPAAPPAPATPAPAAPAAPAAGGKNHRAAASVRVDADRLDMLMHTMGELVVHRTALEALVTGSSMPGLAQAVQDVTRSSQALQAMVMQVRMIAVEAVFLRFPRVVRDLSSRLDKKVELKLVGQDTELDRTVVDALGDPMAHLVRNSLDHGLEGPDERTAAGKEPTGILEISARHSGANVLITVSDDGRGIDAARVAQRAAERGLISPDAVASIDMAAAVELLFAPGFSTAETTSDISGRGIGMDAVRTTIRELGGEVTMQSELGKGTTSIIRMPLTLAIMPALVVGVDDDPAGSRYAIPIDRIERIVDLRDVTVRSIAGRDMLLLPEGTLPLSRGSMAFGEGGDARPAHAVIVRGADRRVAVGVTRLHGQRELVTRPLPPDLNTTAAVSGAAVLAEGGIALIADCDALAEAGAPVTGQFHDQEIGIPA
ncbi:chemotaxis protein CheA [Patulibacter americanus]|uniref:chemotaxis protein CheA n=1 Tax=Patulibacter americanus TaxID=588672 RepID=UPI0003B34658|nr:chemotaxis protein CheA [Patulibacter americanus]